MEARAGSWRVSLRPLWTTLIVALAVVGCFLLIVGSPSLLGIREHPSLSLAGTVWLTLRLMGGELRQTIGVFGWLDVLAPTWVIAALDRCDRRLGRLRARSLAASAAGAALARRSDLRVSLRLRDTPAEHGRPVLAGALLAAAGCGPSLDRRRSVACASPVLGARARRSACGGSAWCVRLCT